MREITARVLGRAGYTVLEAQDGEEALQMVRRHAGHIDLVITDVVMARLGGLELARRVAGERPGLPILLMSGYNTEEMPADDPTIGFLQKPFTPNALLQLSPHCWRTPDGQSRCSAPGAAALIRVRPSMIDDSDPNFRGRHLGARLVYKTLTVSPGWTNVVIRASPGGFGRLGRALREDVGITGDAEAELAASVFDDQLRRVDELHLSGGDLRWIADRALPPRCRLGLYQSQCFDPSPHGSAPARLVRARRSC